MENVQPKVTILSVNEVPDSTAINRSALRRLGNQTVNVDINVRVVPNIEKSLVSIVVSCSYLAQIGFLRYRVLVSSVVANFGIENLAKVVIPKGDEYVIPADLMLTMLGVAVGALRGVVAVRTQGTKLRNSPLPLIDLNTLMYRLHYGQTPVDR